MNRNYMLGVLVVLYTLNFVDRQILAILVEPIKAEFGFSDTAMGFLTGFAFAMFYATLGIPIAHLADRTKRVNIIAICVALWSAMTAVCGLAQNFWQLAVARIGVGIGEAGLTPPAHSMLTDSFPPDRRGRAFAIYQMGVPAGSLLGLLLGGWIAEFYGWRMAFFVAGIPGIALALLFKLTVPEPKRGAFDGDNEPQPPFWPSFRVLWQIGAFRHTSLAMGFSSFAFFGVANWLPAFFGRTYGMGTAEIATIMAPVGLTSNFIGYLAGGYLSDRLGKIHTQRYLWVAAAGMFGCAPFYVGIFFAPSAALAFTSYFLMTMFLGLAAAPSFAIIQGRSPQRLRAMASAIALFLASIMGIGVGPLVVGMVSDALTARLGMESLKYALAVAVPFVIWSGFHYYWAGKIVKREDSVEPEVQLAVPTSD